VALAHAVGSVVIAPPHDLLGNGSGRVWDFRSRACKARQGEVVLAKGDGWADFSLAQEPGAPAVARSLFFNRSNCEAVGLDSLSLRTRRRVALHLIAPQVPVMVAPVATNHPPQLVIHIRGGDVFSKRATLGRRRQYGQPPLAMYQRILLDGGYLTAGWPVTVLHEDDANPVVGALKAWWPPAAAGAVRFVSGGSLADAVAVLGGATHLVTAVSTLSFSFGLLAAPGLERVFIPFCRQRLLAGFLYDNGGDGTSAHKRRGHAAMRRLIDSRTDRGQVDVGIPGACKRSG